jgi:hypothetical protein
VVEDLPSKGEDLPGKGENLPIKGEDLSSIPIMPRKSKTGIDK